MSRNCAYVLILVIALFFLFSANTSKYLNNDQTALLMGCVFVCSIGAVVMVAKDKI